MDDPGKHGTARFHLGVTLLREGRLAEARAAFEAAVRLLDAGLLPVEHAKAVNALGAVMRQGGHTHDAAEAFRRAAADFQAADQPLEQGAALFNLGLVEREAGEDEAAIASFARSRELLDPARVPAQASAAAREHGAALLALGRLDAAADTLATAVALAERGGDAAALGAAANALGLTRLGQGELDAAVEALRTAAAAHPRSVRPAEHAMAKANLAIAYERSGHRARARLAARQTLAIPDAPAPVAEQAAGVVGRLGSQPGDLLAVLDAEPEDNWLGIFREELIRWVSAPPVERRAEAAEWIDGLAARPDSAQALTGVLLDALLELPPSAMDAVIRSLLEALAVSDAEAAASFSAQTWRGMAAFQVPQEERLRGRFEAIAAELGQEPGWR